MPSTKWKPDQSVQFKCSEALGNAENGQDDDKREGAAVLPPRRGQHMWEIAEEMKRSATKMK